MQCVNFLCVSYELLSVWASFMLTWEMMTLSAIATYALRPSQSIFFDKYPIVDSTAANAGEFFSYQLKLTVY